jgi:hypothetical protein
MEAAQNNHYPFLKDHVAVSFSCPASALGVDRSFLSDIKFLQARDGVHRSKEQGGDFQYSGIRLVDLSSAAASKHLRVLPQEGTRPSLMNVFVVNGGVR